MTFNLNDTQRLLLKGQLVVLKRMDIPMLDDFYKSLEETSPKTKMLTTTATIFHKSGVERYLNRINEDSSRMDFAILSAKDGQWLGDIALNDFDQNSGICNFRIAIDKEENFGKGYGQEAMYLLMNYGFGMMGVRRMELEVLADNPRAIHVYEKMGFKKEGVRREACYFNYQYKDMVTMACLKRDFIDQFPEVLTMSL